jgi:hypothetical protein
MPHAMHAPMSFDSCCLIPNCFCKQVATTEPSRSSLGLLPAAGEAMAEGAQRCCGPCISCAGDLNATAVPVWATVSGYGCAMPRFLKPAAALPLFHHIPYLALPHWHAGAVPEALGCLCCLVVVMPAWAQGGPQCVLVFCQALDDHCCDRLVHAEVGAGPAVRQIVSRIFYF